MMHGPGVIISKVTTCSTKFDVAPYIMAYASHPMQAPSAETASTVDQDERQYRRLSFEAEEGRVRRGLDTYLHGGEGLGDSVRLLKNEVERLVTGEEVLVGARNGCPLFEVDCIEGKVES